MLDISRGSEEKFFKDQRGVMRGACLEEECDCDQFERSHTGEQKNVILLTDVEPDKAACIYCGHLPPAHIEATKSPNKN